MEEFPILGYDIMRRGTWVGCPRGVPWGLVAPLERRVRLNHYQSLEQIARRGGLSVFELACVLKDQDFVDMSAAQAIQIIEAALGADENAQ